MGRADAVPLANPYESVTYAHDVTDAVASLEMCGSCADIKLRVRAAEAAALARWLAMAASSADGRVRDFMDQVANEGNIKREQRDVVAASRSRSQHIKVTSGFNFEGHAITAYHGFVSEETAVGMGFFKSIAASLSNVSGTESDAMRTKLRESKQDVVDRLLDSAVNAGGNAIIGLDLDYTMFTDAILGVIVSGTAVTIVPDNAG